MSHREENTGAVLGALRLLRVAERHRRVDATRGVAMEVARNELEPVVVTVAPAQDEDVLRADVAMRGISPARFHPDQDRHRGLVPSCGQIDPLHPRVAGVLPRQTLEAPVDPQTGDLHIREGTGRPPPGALQGSLRKADGVPVGQFDPAQRSGTGASGGPVLTTATERMVATVVELGDAAIPAALLRELRVHGLADRATIWRKGAGSWVLQRSLGGPTPDPGSATAPGWRTVGLETFPLGPEGALVVDGPSSSTAADREAARDLVEALATLAGALLTDPEISANVDDADLVPPALPDPLSRDEDEGNSRDEAA